MFAGRMLVLTLSLLLAACGGGHSSGNDRATEGASAPVNQPGASLPPDSGTSFPQEPFHASLLTAPEDGALIADKVRLEIQGADIGNAELLPASGGKPYAIFHVTPDKSRAWVDFDSRTLRNGEVAVIIEAYDKPPRNAGARAVTAMPGRTWTVSNDTIYSSYPGIYPLRRDKQPLQEMLDLSEQEFRELIENEWPRVHALLQEYIPDNVIFQPPTPRGFQGPRDSCIRDAYSAPLACREYVVRIMMLIP